MNYLMTVRTVFFLAISLNIALYFFGYLRASVLYDYLAYWPLTLFLVFIHFLIDRIQIKDHIKSATLLISTIPFIVFPVLHILIQPSFLPTYSVETEVNRINELEDYELSVIIEDRKSVV